MTTTLQEYEDFVAKADISSITLHELHAETVGTGEPAGMQFQFEAASRLREPSGIDFRVRAHALVEDAEHEGVFDLNATWIVPVDFESEPASMSDELRTQFQTDVVLMAVFPYVRELVQATAARFGVANLVIPLMKRGELNPQPPAAEDRVEDAAS